MVRSALRLMWFWSVKLEVWNFTRNILRSLVGLIQKIFCCLAGPGEEGSIQQIAGPKEDYASKFVQDKRGKSRMQSLSSSGERPYQGKSLLHPAGDIFFTRATELGDYDTCRMAATRTCVCHVKMQVNHMQSQENGLPPCSMNASRVGWLPLVMPTRRRAKGKASNSTVRST